MSVFPFHELNATFKVHRENGPAAMRSLSDIPAREQSGESLTRSIGPTERFLLLCVVATVPGSGQGHTGRDGGRAPSLLPGAEGESPARR